MDNLNPRADDSHLHESSSSDAVLKSVMNIHARHLARPPFSHLNSQDSSDGKLSLIEKNAAHHNYATENNTSKTTEELFCQARSQRKLVQKSMALKYDLTVYPNNMERGSGSTPFILPKGTHVGILKSPEGLVFVRTQQNDIYQFSFSPLPKPSFNSTTTGRKVK